MAPTCNPTHQRAKDLAVVLSLAILYYAGARLGLSFAIPPGHATPVYPPPGIALAAVLLFGNRVWPGIWLGSTLANVSVFMDIPGALPLGVLAASSIGVGASLQALVAAFFVRRFAGTYSFSQLSDFFKFVLLGGLLSCVVSATIGILSLSSWGFVPWPTFATQWMTWWLGDVAGVLVVTPALLIWRKERFISRHPASIVEASALFLLLAVTTYTVFTLRYPPFLILPFTIWAAVRLGPQGSSIAVPLTSVLAIWGTVHETGPFVIQSLNSSLLLLQAFLGVVSVTSLALSVDIAERRRAEEKVHESEQRLQALVDHFPAVIYLKDQHGRYLLINRSFENLFGMDREMVKGKTDFDLFPPEMAKVFRRTDREVLEGGNLSEWEETVQHPDGLHAYLTIKFPIQSPAGLTICGISKDVTERKRAEEESRTHLASLRLVIDAVPAFISYVGADQRYRLVNKMYEQWLECSSKDIIGKHVQEILGETVYEKAQPHIFRALAGERVQYELILPRKKGPPLIDNVTYVPDVANDGAVLGFFTLAFDIRERKETEAALRKAHNEMEQRVRERTKELADINTTLRDEISERKQAEDRLSLYREIIANSSEAIAILDLKGHHLEQNSAHRQLLGYSDEELRANTPALHLGQELFSRIVRQLVEIGVYTGEVSCVRKSGERLQIDLAAFVVRDDNGLPICYVGFKRDITHRKQAEQQLQDSYLQLRALAAHLESVREEERARIARELHDELGQMLTVLKMEISGMRGCLKESIYAGDSLDSMMKLIDNAIVSVRRMVAELRPALLDHLDFEDALDWQLQDFQRRTGVSCVVERDVSGVGLKPAIKTALFRIVQEALTNVARHAAATQVKVQIECDGEQFRLVVQDNGKGMKEEDMSGLHSFGIIGMRERAILLGGEISFSGTPNKGTTITVRIPLGKTE